MTTTVKDTPNTVNITESGVRVTSVGRVGPPTDVFNALQADVTALTPGPGQVVVGGAEGPVSSWTPSVTGGLSLLDPRYGIVADGATDNGVAIQALLDAWAAAGLGDVILPPGDYGWSGTITVPNGVNLRGGGAGKGANGVRLVALSADSQLAFGGLGAVNGSRGGVSGNFVVDGNHLATNPMFVGRSIQRTFQNIDIVNAVGTDLLIQEAQNNLFLGVNAADCGGACMALDLGAGGNCFLRCEFENPGAGHSNVEFLATAPRDAGVDGVYSQPTHNAFYHCILERGAVGIRSSVYHAAGTDNSFYSCNLSQSVAVPLVIMDKPGAEFSDTLFFSRVFLYGNNVATGFDIRASGCQVMNFDRPKLNQLAYAYKVATGGKVWLNSRENRTNLGAYYDPASTGLRTSCIRHQEGGPVEHWADSINDAAGIKVVVGEAGARFQELAYGEHQWGDGTTFSFDTNLKRGSANLLQTDDRFRAVDGITTKTKAGAPNDADFASPPADGTVVIDTTGSKIYVRIGGAWKATAALT